MNSRSRMSADGVVAESGLHWLLLPFLTAAAVSVLNPDAMGFKSPTHAAITDDALRRVQRVVDGETLSFTPVALNEVSLHNQQSDCLQFLAWHLYGYPIPSGLRTCLPQNANSFNLHELHFDSDHFSAGSAAIIERRSKIIEFITAPSPDGAEARRELGRALHAIQDFYAHSNYVELTDAGVLSPLPLEGFGTRVLPDPPPYDPRFPDNNTQYCSQTRQPADVLGTFLNDPTGLSSTHPLTSGYWYGASGCDQFPPPGRCLHGNLLASGALGGCVGTHKDDASLSGHERAREFAETSTRDFIEGILNERGVAGNAKAIRALMGITGRGTLAFVVDVTSSMEDEIAQVKAEITSLVSEIVASGEEPAEYLFLPFNDPDIGEPVVTRDAMTFQRVVENIRVSEGGDCPEPSQTALLRALSASQKDSTLLLFTDASSSDPEVADAAIKVAKDKRITVSPVLSGSCSSLDPVFLRNAAETGGQAFFLGEREVHDVFQLVRPQLARRLTNVKTISDVLESVALCSDACRTASDGECDDGGPGSDYSICDLGTDCLDCGPREGASGVRDIPIVVDSTIEQLVVAVSMETKESVTLRSPAGVLLSEGDPGVTVSNFANGCIVSIVAPQPGRWTLQAIGGGAFSMTARAASEIDALSFEFVVESGRAGHEALFPFPGQPLVGGPVLAAANVFGPFVNPSFHMISPTGDEIGVIELATGNPLAAPSDFVGTVSLPDQPFLVAVSGEDGNGFPFERVFPGQFRGQSVQVTTDADLPMPLSLGLLPLGAKSSPRFHVRNLGPSDTFRVTVTDNRGLVTRAEPSSVSIESGGVATVEVDVVVPADFLEREICPPGTDCSDCGPAAYSGGEPICSNDCRFDFDNDCDDGGPGSDYSNCDYGTDCGDCGPRDSASAPATCSDSCVLALNGQCDDQPLSFTDVQITLSAVSESQAEAGNSGSLLFLVTGCTACDRDPTNSGFVDCDDNGIDDGCELCLTGPSSDTDNDAVLDRCDNCVGLANPNQTDIDMDGIGDGCVESPVFQVVPSPPMASPQACGTGAIGMLSMSLLTMCMVGNKRTRATRTSERPTRS
ncbi:MAG: hypothetical protein HOP29_02380 [Phycisphaerales bacterium]|nr:hypothetical protein [Phycisphaerales bacterium]